ncbi:MAG: nucleotidyl transferase AbiEii/AbiGii toxin family protein [Planctomycetales bacterium]
MIKLYEAAQEVESCFRRHGWKFALIGGLAVIRWGRPRATQDIDFSLFVEFGDEGSLVAELLNEFDARIDDPHSFATTNRVLLIRASNGVEVDVGLAGFPFELEMLERSTPFEFRAGVLLTTVSAEDLMVLKAFAGRPIDWFDVEGIAVRQERVLDWDSVIERIRSLEELIGESIASPQLEAIREKSRKT